MRRLALPFVVSVMVACGGSTPDAIAPVPSSSAVAERVSSPETAPEKLPAPEELVALPRAGILDVWSRPGPGAVIHRRFWSGNGFHQRIRFPVLKMFRDAEGTMWLDALLSERPNGSRGWLRRDDVTLSRVHDRIVVDLSARRLVRYRDGEPVTKLEIAVGAETTPTTTGRFFVWARVHYPDASGPYGPLALGLSGFSDVITGWVGGGRLAIHGTNDRSDLGVPCRTAAFAC